MNTIATNQGAAAASSAGVGLGGATQSAADMSEQFLKLLVTQLKNQDPLNPVDNAQMTSQMAQISTVTGVQQVNKAIQDLVAQMASTQMLQSSALVGRNVLVDGNKLPVKDGKAAGAVDLVGAADSVKIDILSAGGQVIDTINLGAQTAGRHLFDWASNGRITNGVVGYRVTATQAGEQVKSAQLARDSVDSVSTDNGAMNVQLRGLGNLTYDKVRAIL